MFLVFLALVMFRSLLILEPAVVLISADALGSFDEGTDCLVRRSIGFGWILLTEILGCENLREFFIVSV